MQVAVQVQRTVPSTLPREHRVVAEHDAVLTALPSLPAGDVMHGVEQALEAWQAWVVVAAHEMHGGAADPLAALARELHGLARLLLPGQSGHEVAEVPELVTLAHGRVDPVDERVVHLLHAAELALVERKGFLVPEVRVAGHPDRLGHE